jgi:hypothetical membrane protein
MRQPRPIAGILFFVLSAQFLLFLMVGESIAPGYSMHDNAISDLGVIAETAALFTASMVIAGLLNIIGGYLLYRSHRRAGTLVLFVLAGVGTIGAGLIALDHPSGLHGLFALIAFLFFNIEAIASARLVQGPMRAVSALAGIIGLAFLVVMFLGDADIVNLFGPIGHGGSERMIVYPPILWLMAFGGYLMAPPSETVERIA